jgi:hypothetical protein
MRLQVENEPTKSVRAQAIKLADELSNLRAILAVPRLNGVVVRSQERRYEHPALALRVFVVALKQPSSLI